MCSLKTNTDYNILPPLPTYRTFILLQCYINRYVAKKRLSTEIVVLFYSFIHFVIYIVINIVQ